jgi:glycosyltransferase involved in cell wall biosynthesis
MINPQSISIITPSFNQGAFIGEALASVQYQEHANCEHLVIDGASTDNTTDILLAHTAGPDQSNVCWVSELDSGQSEALNKGFRKAKGEIIGWLNADDRYRPGCFGHVVKAFAENPEIDIIYGDYLIVDDSGNALQIRREIEFNQFILLYHHVLYIPTTATFFRRRIFDEENWLNENLHYAMDLEFFIRLSARGYRFKHIPEILADFRLHPDSKTCKSSDKQRMERQQVVLAVVPILRRVDSLYLKRAALAFFWSIACVKRYSEKLLRGYYWENLRSIGSDSLGL